MNKKEIKTSETNLSKKHLEINSIPNEVEKIHSPKHKENIESTKNKDKKQSPRHQEKEKSPKDDEKSPRNDKDVRNKFSISRSAARENSIKPSPMPNVKEVEDKMLTLFVRN